MSLAEVFPEARALPREDKIELLRVLLKELEVEEAFPIQSGQTYPIWSPLDAFAAADTLWQVLEEKNR